MIDLNPNRDRRIPEASFSFIILTIAGKLKNIVWSYLLLEADVFFLNAILSWQTTLMLLILPF